MESTHHLSLFTPLIALAILLPSPTHAAIILDGNYVYTRAELDAGTGPNSGSDAIDVDPLSADTDESEVINILHSAAGRAWASNASGLSLQARSTSSAPNVSSFFAPSSSTNVRSAYRDAVLPDAPGAPAQISFNFSVHAELIVSQTIPSTISGETNVSRAIVSAVATNNVINFQNALFGNALSADIRNSNGSATTTALDDSVAGYGWSTTEFTLLGPNHYDFNGSFSYVADLNIFGPGVPEAPFGAYFVGVGLGTQTLNVGGTSATDATSTLNLMSITLPGGTPLPAGLNLGFESGASPLSVPLPPAGLLFVGALTILRRRSQRPGMRRI